MKQIKKLKDTRESRIAMAKNKQKEMQKEIESLKQENENLIAQGAKVSEDVNQRKEIYNMMHGKKEGEQEEVVDEKNKNKRKELPGDDLNDNQGYKKAMYVRALISGRLLPTDDCLIRPRSLHRNSSC
jgi:hypothetical protein